MTTLQAAATNPALPAILGVTAIVGAVWRGSLDGPGVREPDGARKSDGHPADDLFAGPLAFKVDRSIRAQVERRVDGARVDPERFPYDRHNGRA